MAQAVAIESAIESAIASAVKPADILSPAVARRTRKILALQEKGKAKMRELAVIIADIPA